MPQEPHDQPSDVCAETGEVHIDGPGGTAVAMTPRAAVETSDRLLNAAVQAMGQANMAAVRYDRRD